MTPSDRLRNAPETIAIIIILTLGSVFVQRGLLWLSESQKEPPACEEKDQPEARAELCAELEADHWPEKVR